MARTAIIGSGLIGRAWAISFARGGHEVALFDEDRAAPGKAIAFIRDALPDLAANELLNGETPESVLGRIREETDLTAALRGASHVQENTPEKLDLKKAVFAELDALAAPQAVLASSSSALLPSSFTEALPGRARCLVAHPINPPHLVPAVEIVPAPWTSAEAMEQTRAFMAGCGQKPIVMQREIDGFIMNRMQGALLEEAFRLVADGYASVEDVDTGIRDGLALRWSFMGPFETIDLNAPGGVRDYALRYQNIYERLFPQMQRRVDWAGPVMDRIEAERRKALPADRLASRQQWRDRRLMDVVAARRRATGKIGD
ncbi:MAG TPA: 3-hydroxyacyl-CoA dehydrogenase [Bauldia sp.]|nr:3-hydroxyacyl-CoA dehydrogenase [Bauldia sp.]